MFKRNSNPSENGSAYLTALLALVILTLLGLTLAATSGTESMIGAHERGQTKVRYQAEAALNEAINVSIFTAECAIVESRWGDEWSDAFGDEAAKANFVNLGQSSVVTASKGFCNMCDVAQNTKGTRGKPFNRTSSYAVARATRFTNTPESGGQTIARSQVNAILELDPVDIKGGGGELNMINCLERTIRDKVTGEANCGSIDGEGCPDP